MKLLMVDSMEQVGSFCAIDENVNNRLRIEDAPVRHSAADTNGVSTQSRPHSAVRYRRRKVQESEMPNGVDLSRSALQTADDLSSRWADELDFEVSSNGTLSPRVDTSDKARSQMTHLNYRSSEHCQNPSADVKNADGNAVLAHVRRQRKTEENKRISDGTTFDNSIRTLPSNGVACVSDSLDGETSPVTAENDVPVFEYSNSDSEVKNSFSDARKGIFRRRPASEYRVPDTSVKETVVNGFPAIEYEKSDSTIGDARNDNNKIIQRSGSDSALAKAGDFDREREIERRMRELGLWERKREQERHLAELLDAQISRRDGLTAALRRCRRRQRGQAVSAADDIRSHVNQNFVR